MGRLSGMQIAAEHGHRRLDRVAGQEHDPAWSCGIQPNEVAAAAGAFSGAGAHRHLGAGMQRYGVPH